MNKIELTKERLAEVPGVLKALENGIINGEIEGLELPVIIAALEKWIDYAKSNESLQNAVDASYLAHVSKTVDFKGSKITKVQGRAKYDYSKIENHNYRSLCKEFEYYKEQKAIAEKVFILNMKKEPLVHEITGEIISFETPEVTYGKDYFTVKF